MSNFNFNTASIVGNSVSKKSFAACEIHDVIFVNAEERDVQKKDGSTSKALAFTFEGATEENKSCVFEHVIWEPTDKDFEVRTSQYGPQPKGIDNIMATIKHILLNVSEPFADLDAKGKGISAATWEQLRKEVVKYCKPSAGKKKTQIKLFGRVYENRLLPCFPSFVLGISKDGGQLYMKTNFIGEKLFLAPSDLKEFSKLKEKLSSEAPAQSRSAQDTIREAAAKADVNQDLEGALNDNSSII